MKKLTKSKVNEILLEFPQTKNGRRGGSQIINQINKLKMGEGLHIARSEWKYNALPSSLYYRFSKQGLLKIITTKKDFYIIKKSTKPLI